MSLPPHIERQRMRFSICATADVPAATLEFLFKSKCIAYFRGQLGALIEAADKYIPETDLWRACFTHQWPENGLFGGGIGKAPIPRPGSIGVSLPRASVRRRFDARCCCRRLSTPSHLRSASFIGTRQRYYARAFITRAEVRCLGDVEVDAADTRTSRLAVRAHTRGLKRKTNSPRQNASPTYGPGPASHRPCALLPAPLTASLRRIAFPLPTRARPFSASRARAAAGAAARRRLVPVGHMPPSSMPPQSVAARRPA